MFPNGHNRPIILAADKLPFSAMRHIYPLAAAAFVNLLLPYLVSAASPPSPLRPLYCSTEIVLLSPCLPYISLPPNNLSLSVPPRCCDAFSPSAISHISCLCYLFRQPSMLGFPLNLTKLSGLPADCKVRDVDLPTEDLKSLCSDSPPLPPPLSSQGSTQENPANAGPSEAPSQLPDPPRDPTINSSLSPGIPYPKEVVSPATPGSAPSLWVVNQLNLLIWCAIFPVCRRML